MITNNEYFDGRVKSLGFQSPSGKATVGVMEAGDYEFSTAGAELMKVVSGVISAQLPGESVYRDYSEGAGFSVPANSKFKVRMRAQAAYLCLYS